MTSTYHADDYFVLASHLVNVNIRMFSFTSTRIYIR